MKILKYVFLIIFLLSLFMLWQEAYPTSDFYDLDSYVKVEAQVIDIYRESDFVNGDLTTYTITEAAYNYDGKTYYTEIGGNRTYKVGDIVYVYVNKTNPAHVRPSGPISGLEIAGLVFLIISAVFLHLLSYLIKSSHKKLLYWKKIYPGKVLSKELVLDDITYMLKQRTKYIAIYGAIIAFVILIFTILQFIFFHIIWLFAILLAETLIFLFYVYLCLSSNFKKIKNLDIKFVYDTLELKERLNEETDKMESYWILVDKESEISLFGDFVSFDSQYSKSVKFPAYIVFNHERESMRIFNADEVSFTKPFDKK